MDISKELNPIYQDIQEFCTNLEKKLTSLLNSKFPQEENQQEEPVLEENYISCNDFDEHLNLFSRSFVNTLCRKSRVASSFCRRIGRDWEIKPIAFLNYVARSQHKGSHKAQYFLKNSHCMAILNDLLEQRRNQ